MGKILQPINVDQMRKSESFVYCCAVVLKEHTYRVDQNSLPIAYRNVIGN